MIDWRSVIFTAIWVSGLSILLAGWSYSRWSRRTTPRSAVWLGLLLLIGGLLALRVTG